MTESNKVATDGQIDGIREHLLTVCLDEHRHSYDDDWVWRLILRIESDRLALAEKETEIQRLRRLCGEAKKPLALLDGWEALAEKLDRALKGEL